MNNLRILSTRRDILGCLLVITLSLLATQRCLAATVIYVGTNSVSATTNWSDTVNFTNSAGGGFLTPANNAANFNFDTAVATPGVVTVHADGGYGAPGVGSPQAWGMIFGQTNGYHTVLIDPGIQLQMIAANGTAGGGGLIVAPANRTSGGNTGGNTVATGTYTNYTTITGTGASFLVNGQVRVEAGSTAVNNHYSILDMSGLDTFIATNTSSGSSRFQVVNGSTRSQALVYLAKTNFINIYSDVTIGWMGGLYSNSLPIGLYLGQSNSITTGPNDNGNQLVIAIQGVTNAFMRFNPAFLGGPAKPTVYISGNGAASGNGGFPTVSGMMAGAIIGRADTAKVPSFGVADFTGGIVTWNVGQLHLGRSGAANGTNTTAMGTLTFDSGTITANDIWCGWQQADGAGAQGANPGIGLINIGSSATLQVNNTLRLAVVVGTPVAGSAGTVNVNGGTVIAGHILGGGGAATLNTTNGALGLPATSPTTTNSVVSTLSVGGSTNILNITAITPVLGSGYPVRFHLLAYTTLNGTLNFGLGSLLASYDPSTNYSGHLDTSTTPNVIDFVLTGGPQAARNLTWSGTNGIANPDGDWDLSTPDWLTGGAPTAYNQFDLVSFKDTTPGATNINLTTTLTPYSVTVTNTASQYTFGTSGTGGKLSGAMSLTKQGTGTLILDENNGLGQGYNDFTGGITISNGTVQVGNGDGNGSLGSGPVADNGALVFNHGANATVANVISGSGTLMQMGADTLTLSGANTFTNTVLVTNNSVLQLGSGTALGATNGGTIIANGSTLDLNGFNPGYEPITVQGTGVGGSGAILNNNSASVPHLGAVTLAGDTTFGGSQRWDLTNKLSASSAHNVTLAFGSSVYHEWRDLNASTAVGNITVASGTLGWTGNTSAGTGGTLEVTGGAFIKFYNDGSLTATLAKPLLLDDGSTVANGGGANTISAPITLNGYDTFDIGATSLTLSGALNGTGTLYKQAVANAGNTAPLYITGASPSFSGSVSLYAGKIYLNGSLGSGSSSSITSQSGTVLAGTGTNNGPVDVNGALLPGDAGVAGTFTVGGGGLTLEASAFVTNDLSALIAGTNDLIKVTGNLTLDGAITLYVNLIGGTLQNGTYPLITYTGSVTGPGSLAAQPAVLPSIYTLTLATNNALKRIEVSVSGTPSLLVWNNNGNNGEWDNYSFNWTNVAAHTTEQFINGDTVVFDDSITNSPTPTTLIDIASGLSLSPGVVTNNSTTNYTISGAGAISGGASLVKMGSSTLTLSNPNSFSGPVTILGGTVVGASATALGSGVGTITVTNGGTLDAGYPLGAQPIVVSGAGVGGNGAIVNNNSPHIWDSNGGLTTTLTLMGDTTFGGSNRWDLGSTTGATLSTGGKPYSVSVTGPVGGYKEWQAVTIDPTLTNINILAAELGVKGMTNLGDPNGTVTIYSNAQLTFWGGSNYTKNYYVKSGGTMLVRQDGPVFNLNMTLEGGAIFHSIDNVKTMTAPVNLVGVAQFLSDSATCTFSNVISGVGGIAWTGNANQFAFAAANTYQGPTLIGNGLTLALLGSGSISSSSLIFFGGTDTNAFRIDVSGKNDQTLTLASGQALEGAGRVNGALTVAANATVAPGTNITFGAIGAAGAVTLNGSTTLKIYNPTANDAIQSSTSIAYGGTLNLEFLPGNLAAGNSWKLFNAPSYSGSFTVSPSSPGTGLLWDTSRLTIDGTLRVISSTPPDITSITVGGGNVILSGTNGSPSAYYLVLSSTNVAKPLNQWQPIATNQFDASGNFNWTNALTADPARFFRVQLQ